MGYYTIDPYYNTEFYNQCKEALKNNGVQYKEYISVKAPHEFYFETPSAPTFINYDEANESYSRWLVNIVTALKPNDDYIYTRRDSFTATAAVNHYAINDALRSSAITKEGIFFSATRDEVLRISKEYPRKIYYMGRYFNRKYRVFFTDNLIIMNFLRAEQILVKGKGFKSVTELEVELNWNVFQRADRLVKVSDTPYVLSGKYYPPVSIRPEISDRYVLS